jgi:signal transduction histidine kinase
VTNASNENLRETVHYRSECGLISPTHDNHLPSNASHENHAERVELLGEMATGIAHEFNNLLTIELGSLEQLRRQPLNERGQTQLTRAEWGARQAERLARQMLNLADRRRVTQPQVVNLNATIAEFDKIISHAVKVGTRLMLELSPDPLPVRLDPIQLELALLNLVRNASDAMETGVITIRTTGHRIDGLGGKPTVEVAVSDTGSGMPPEIAQQATTGFFTTKAPGQGSGLGLWMVQSFVTDWDGKLDIETAVGQGTTVRLVFPRAE